MNEQKDNRNSDEIKIPVKWINIILITAVVLVLAFFIFNSGIGINTGKAVSETKAKENLVNFFETQVPGSSLTIISSSKQGNFYEVFINLDGETFPVYITLDGKFLVVDRIPLN